MDSAKWCIPQMWRLSLNTNVIIFNLIFRLAKKTDNMDRTTIIETISRLIRRRDEYKNELKALRDRVNELEKRLDALDRKTSGTDDKTRQRVLACLANHMKMKHVSAQDAAQRTGIPYPALEAVLTGRKAITRDQAKRLASAYGLNTGFLLKGEGKLTVKKGAAAPAESRIERYYQNKYCN